MRVEEFLNSAETELNSDAADTWIAAELADEYIVDSWSASGDKGRDFFIRNEEKVLEIRLFNEAIECRLSRPDIGGKFVMRIRRDCDKDEYIDEDQIMDTDPGAVLRVRYYLNRYESTGQAYVGDWRMVGIKEDM